MSQGHDNSVEGGRIDVIRQAMTNIKLYNLSLPLKIVKPTTASLKKSDNIRKVRLNPDGNYIYGNFHVSMPTFAHTLNYAFIDANF